MYCLLVVVIVTIALQHWKTWVHQKIRSIHMFLQRGYELFSITKGSIIKKSY